MKTLLFLVAALIGTNAFAEPLQIYSLEGK
jgi:hypothetical protein